MYKILHLPTGTFLYSFSDPGASDMLFSEIETASRIKENKKYNTQELCITEFSKEDAIKKLTFCFDGNIGFSFDDNNQERKENLFEHHIALIEAVHNEKM